MARSRGELEEIIKRGEAVLLHDGRVVTKIEDLPSAVELAGDDIVKRQQAVADLEAAVAKAQADLAAAQAKGDEAKVQDSKPASTDVEVQEFLTEDPTKKTDIKAQTVGRKPVDK